MASTRALTFAAIDFETANQYRDSACAVGVAVVRDGVLDFVEEHLIRPPTRQFAFTHIHGLTWADVRNAPTFPEIWKAIQAKIGSTPFLSAHNASFDRSVIEACCRSYGLERPLSKFVCTVTVAREIWNLRPTKLSDVCRHLRIALNHHKAGSDAEACARIVLAAAAEGWRNEPATGSTAAPAL